MSVYSCLRKARELVAGGWSEPTPQGSDGRWCEASDERATRFDVDTALQLSAERWHDYLQARELLEAIVNPATTALNAAASWPDELTMPMLRAMASAAAAESGNLATWLETPGRPLAHVLRLFDYALMNSRTREAA